MKQPTRKQLNRARKITALIIITLTIGLLILFSSCASQPQNLMEHNKYHYKVIGSDFPYVEVVKPDSTTKYIYMPYYKGKDYGYIITER